MDSLTYLCFVPAKGLIRDLPANSSNIAFEVPLASNDGGNLALYHIRIPNCVICHSQTWKKCKNLTINNYSQLYIRKVSDESLGRDETYVCNASHSCLMSNSCTFFKYLHIVQKWTKKSMWEIIKISRFLSARHRILPSCGCNSREIVVSNCELVLWGTSPVD